MTIPISKYKCQKCGFCFELPNPQPVDCPECKHHYVDWLNYEEVLKYLYENDPDFHNYRSV